MEANKAPKHRQTAEVMPDIPVFTSLYTILLFRAIFLIAFLYLLKMKYYEPAFFLFFLMLVIEAAALWSKSGLKKLQAEVSPYPCRLFPGDEIKLAIQCQNKKRLPVFLSWSHELPPEFRLLETDEAFQGKITGRAYLGAFGTEERQYRLTIEKRGYYSIPSLTLYSRDILGLFYRQKTVPCSQRLMVYPKLIELADIELKAADFSGLEKDQRPFLFDPIMFVGLRDYTPDMPTRFIHWKATAHKDRLLAKIIEPSASLQILIAIEAASLVKPDDGEALFEKALSVAATFAVWADENKIPFGLAANISQKEKQGPINLPVNRNLDQGRIVLESLARAEFALCGSLEDILKEMSLNLPWGITLLLLSGNQADLGSAVSRFRQVISYPLGG